MKYESLSPITKVSAERIFSGSNAPKIADALIRLSRFHANCQYTESKCLEFLKSSDEKVRFGAVTGLLLRGAINARTVLPEIELYTFDPNVEITFDEIKRHLKDRSSAEEDWIDYCLENEPRFLKSVAAARRSLRAGKGRRLEDIK